ncbi:MAG: EAL domain-containing protein, partial [Sulfuricurvum sp.]|nr:EAL domain-containing protein [Sulfuricurvum sp.]
HQKSYDEYTDKWGTFRSVFLPMKSPNGNTYVIAADIQIDAINKQLREEAFALLLRLFGTIVLSLPFLTWYLRRINNDLKREKQILADEAKVSDNNLKQSDLKMRAILDATQESIFLLDRDGTILVINSMGAQRFGKKSDELIGQSIFDVMPPEVVEHRSGQIEEIFRTGKSINFEDNWNGLYYSFHCYPVYNANGVMESLAAFGKDITEQKQIEVALREIEEAFISTFNQAAVGIAHVSPDGHWLEMNRKFCDIVGYTKEELLKRTFQTITYPDDLNGDLENIRQILSGDIETYSIEKRYIHKTGKLIWINLTASLVRDDNGNAKYFIKVIEDISLRKQVETALIESEQFLKESQMIAGLGSYILDLSTGVWTSSEILDQLFGIKPAYARTIEGWIAIVHPDERTKMDHYLKNEVIGKGKPFDQEYRIVRQDDQSVHWVHGLGKLEFDTNGLPLKMVGTIQDITERKASFNSLVKLSLAVEQSPNSIVITDFDGNIEYVNTMFTKVTGYSKEEALGKNPRLLKSDETPQSTYVEMWAHLTRGDIWHGELINRRKDKSTYIEMAIISPVKQVDGTITNYLAIKEDITDKKKAEAHIENLAHFDQLTGLPNRVMLKDRVAYLLGMAQRKNEPLAVMFLDLDHFKNINDTLGHTIGDHVLIEIAKRIKATVRDEDTVSRLGGDEFIMLFPNTDSNAAMHIATKLITEISKTSIIEYNELTITPSIGISIYPNDGEDFETLLKNADTAMYRVKNSSRNGFHFFTQEMQLNLARNLQLENALRHALARNELEIYYQPQVAIEDGRIIGAEALLRWHHPELGMISPAEFIPIAESSGQIIEIGEWVLRTAIQQTKEWIDSGFVPMIIAVNLSAIQFRQKNLLNLVMDILEKAQLPSEYLELELTEAVTMHDPKSVIDVMNKFHEQGIRMSIDDFGTGYSSLSYLKQFKVYKLKIDQSFIRDISNDPDDRAIVIAIIDMAHNLGLQTIAEGVETAEQLEFLRLHGCNEVQGYYFSKPLPSEEFERFLHDNRDY